MSHAEARGAGNGNFWAALFIPPRSGYNPGLPSPLSGGKLKPQLVSLGLPGGAGAVLAAGCPGCEVGSGDGCHCTPGQGGSAGGSAVGAAAHLALRHLRVWGGAHFSKGFVGLVGPAAPGDVLWVPSALRGRGPHGGQGAGGRDTGSPGDAPMNPSSN